VGPPGPDGVLRFALSGALPRAGRSWRSVSDDSVSFHAANRRNALACSAARARHRKRLLRVRCRARRQARKRSRDLRPFLGGRLRAEGGPAAGVVMAQIEPSEVVAARTRIPSPHHGRRFELVEPMAEPTYLHAVREPT